MFPGAMLTESKNVSILLLEVTFNAKSPNVLRPRLYHGTTCMHMYAQCNSHAYQG